MLIAGTFSKWQPYFVPYASPRPGSGPLSSTATDKLGTRLNKLVASMAPLNPPPTTTTLHVRFLKRLPSPALPFSIQTRPWGRRIAQQRTHENRIADLINRPYTHSIVSNLAATNPPRIRSRKSFIVMYLWGAAASAVGAEIGTQLPSGGRGLDLASLAVNAEPSTLGGRLELRGNFGRAE
jgi:hypothetical protein